MCRFGAIFIAIGIVSSPTWEIAVVLSGRPLIFGATNSNDISKSLKHWGHLPMDAHGLVMGLKVTTAGVDQCDVVPQLCMGLSGLLLGDKGYINPRLQEHLADHQLSLTNVCSAQYETVRCAVQSSDESGTADAENSHWASVSLV
jgi:hypothetical protein